MKDLEEFNLKVPLLVALKKEGMFERHWKEISEHIGQEVHPDCVENFNYQYCLDIGLMDHKNFCIEVGAKASREYAIELGIKGMKES